MLLCQLLDRLQVEAALHALITHGYDPFTIALQLLLLKQELNVNIFNVMGQTALQIACVLHRQRMGRLILDDPRTDINACKVSATCYPPAINLIALTHHQCSQHSKRAWLAQCSSAQAIRRC